MAGYSEDMVSELQKEGVHQYRCEECGFVYRDKAWAEKCEAWCAEHQSCNLEIIQHGKPSPDQ